MVGFRNWTSTMTCLVSLLGIPLVAQQNVPDAPAPKTTQPNQFPESAPPAPKNSRATETAPAATPTPLTLQQGADALRLI